LLSDSFTSVCNVSTATATLIKEDWKSLTRREINHCRRKYYHQVFLSRNKRAEQNQSRGSIFFQHKSLPTRFDYHYRCLIIFSYFLSIYLYAPCLFIASCLFVFLFLLDIFCFFSFLPVFVAFLSFSCFP
jgi:hypothetical protein